VEIKVPRPAKMFRVVVKKGGLVVGTLPAQGWIGV
jgi:hypothetical protein